MSTGYGPELITNGTFTTDTSGWTPINSTLSVVGGVLRVTNTGAVVGRATQAITTVVGRMYEMVGTVAAGSLNNGYIQFGSSFLLATPGQTRTVTFVATATSTTALLENNSAVLGQTADFDNISVREIIAS